MERKEILSELVKIFADVLDNDALVINENTTANDVEEWDSLNHIQIVVAIERHFHIKFTAGEIRKWNHVGEMVDSITAKLG